MDNRNSLACTLSGNADAYLIVKPTTSTDGNLTVTLGVAATDLNIGVLDEINHVTGETVDVYFRGLRLVRAGGVINPGAVFTANASGKAVATTTAGDRYVGISMHPVATAADDVFLAQICPGIV